MSLIILRHEVVSRRHRWCNDTTAEIDNSKQESFVRRVRSFLVTRYVTTQRHQNHTVSSKSIKCGNRVLLYMVFIIMIKFSVQKNDSKLILFSRIVSCGRRPMLRSASSSIIQCMMFKLQTFKQLTGCNSMSLSCEFFTQGNCMK